MNHGDTKDTEENGPGAAFAGRLRRARGMNSHGPASACAELPEPNLPARANSCFGSLWRGSRDSPSPSPITPSLNTGSVAHKPNAFKHPVRQRTPDSGLRDLSSPCPSCLRGSFLFGCGSAALCTLWLAPQSKRNSHKWDTPRTLSRTTTTPRFISKHGSQ